MSDLELSDLIATIGDYTDDAILITEAEPIEGAGPKILWCNAAFTRMTGYALDEIKGRTPRLLQGPETDRETLDRLKDGLRNWKTTRVELRNFHKNGTPFWVEFIVKPVADKTGHFKYWVSVQRETTDRRERELLLEKTTRVLDNAPIGLALFDPEQNLSFANPQLIATFFGNETPPLLPIPYTRWVQRSLEVGCIAEAIDDPMEWLRLHVGGILSGRFSIEQTINGTWYQFRRLIMSDGSALLLALDITDQRKIQDQLDHSLRLDSMGKMTGGVAHDFNNILAVVLGNLELLEEELVSEDRDTFIQEAVSAVVRGRDLTQQLLSFARKAQLKPQRLTVETELLDVVRLVSRTFAQYLEVNVVVERKTSPIWVDQSLFQNAMINLLVNARDALAATDRGRIEIRARNRVQEPGDNSLRLSALNGNLVEISVTDNGTGIAEHLMPSVVEPFFTTKGVGQGSGLGLAMVHGFANQSGGSIQIKSQEGKGTAVKLLLPAHQSENETLRNETPGKDPTSNIDARVLLVDDDRGVRLVVEKTLLRAGCHVSSAASGDQAIEILSQTQNFDLVITDLVMPGAAQGRDVVKHVLIHCPWMKTIAMSGNPNHALGDRLRDLSDALLLKPVERRVLVRTVEEVLQRANRLAEAETS